MWRRWFVELPASEYLIHHPTLVHTTYLGHDWQLLGHLRVQRCHRLFPKSSPGAENRGCCGRCSCSRWLSQMLRVSRRQGVGAAGLALAQRLRHSLPTLI